MSTFTFEIVNRYDMKVKLENVKNNLEFCVKNNCIIYISVKHSIQINKYFKVVLKV